MTPKKLSISKCIKSKDKVGVVDIHISSSFSSIRSVIKDVECNKAEPVLVNNLKLG